MADAPTQHYPAYLVFEIHPDARMITYRSLLPADIPQYRRVRLECLREFPRNFGATYEEQRAVPKMWMETQIEAQTTEAFSVGAFDDQALIGICGIHRDGAHRRRHIATVIQMYVQAQYSGRKIGFGLLQHTIAEAWKIAELEHLVLEVVTSSQNAIHIYGQAGFEQYGFHKDFLKYDKGYEDALLMVLFRGRV
jgi:RimJ/RimL family protein N-acetyltransferase